MTTAQLTDAFANAKDGSTILVDGQIDITPEVPTDIAFKPAGGAALKLVGKKGVVIQGTPGSVLQLTRHGSGIGFEACENCCLYDVTIRGQGYYLGQEPWYFAAVFLGKGNRRLRVLGNNLSSHGDHGIGHLLGGSLDDSEFAYNTISQCGYLNHPTVGGDGTGIAVSGSRNHIHHNHIYRCFRGLEQESQYPDHNTFDNVWEDNAVIGSLYHGFLIMPTHGRGDLFTRTSIFRNLFQSLPAMAPFQRWNKCHPITISGGSRYLIADNRILGIDSDWVGIDMTPNNAPLTDSTIEGNFLAGGGSTGISVGESQGSTNMGVKRITVCHNWVGPVGGRNIWYNDEGHSIYGNTLVKGKWEPVYSDTDKSLSCAWSNVIV